MLDVISIVFPFLWLYGFHRIDKLRIGIVLIVIVVIANIGLKMLLPFPYGLISAIIVSVIPPIYFLRKWSIEHKKKTNNS